MENHNYRQENYNYRHEHQDYMNISENSTLTHLPWSLRGCE